MLVLTRNKQEEIIINGNIIIKIIAVRNNNVSIGIEAPHSIPVHRKEIFDRLRKKGKTWIGEEDY